MKAETRVEVGTVVVRLHWPTVACSECAGEVEEISREMYMCLSCRHTDSGTVKYVEGRVNANSKLTI